MTDLDGALETLETMHGNGSLDDNYYQQCLVTLASEYLCRRHDPELALILLNRCSSQYFQEVIFSQMRADGMYAQVALELVYRLQQLGLTADTRADTPNQKPGEA